jgi:hypothetical protein
MKLFTKRRPSRPRVRSARLAITRLEERANPADITWTGAGLNSNWDTFANWQGNRVPGASDTAIFDSKAANTFAPVLTTPRDVAGLTITSNCDYSFTFDGGQLTAAASSIASNGLITQTGFGGILTLKTGTHDWSGDVNLDTIYVEQGGTLTLRGGSDFGFLGSSGSIMDIKSTGTVNVEGTHNVSVRTIAVESGGTLAGTSVNSSLDNAFVANKGAHNLFKVSSHGEVDVAKGMSLNITGGYFEQFSGLTKISQGGILSLSGNTGWADGGTSYIWNVSFTGGEMDLYDSGGLNCSDGDQRYFNTAVKLYVPGYHDNLQSFVTIQAGSAQPMQPLYTVKFEGSSSLKFFDYTEAGWANVIQGGTLLNMVANLYIGGTTALSFRLDWNDAVYDYIWATGNVQLAGSTLSLNFDVLNAAGATSGSSRTLTFIRQGPGKTLTLPPYPLFGTKTVTAGFRYKTLMPPNNPYGSTSGVAAVIEKP